VIVADGADGADGIFGTRTDPDHPGSGSPLTDEGDVDAQYSQERLRTTQTAGEGPRSLRPIGSPARDPCDQRSSRAVNYLDGARKL
jgi:hypothetical protein